MRLTIKYYGMLTEVTRCTEETIPFSGTHISDVVAMLSARHTELKNKNFQVAQNNELVSLEDQLTHNEIVLLPPFAGG